MCSISTVAAEKRSAIFFHIGLNQFVFPLLISASPSQCYRLIYFFAVDKVTYTHPHVAKSGSSPPPLHSIQTPYHQDDSTA